MSEAEANISTPANLWVVRLPPRPRARLRLLCFPHAGGNAWMFRQWASHLPEDIEVCGVQLPGHVGRIHEAPVSDFAALLARLVEGLAPEIEMPVALFGHSLGALAAFELARQMRERTGRLPVHLFLSGRNAPDMTDDLDDVLKLDDEAILAKLRELNCTPEPVLRDRETMQLMLPILRADFALCNSYAYRDRAPLDCPITVLYGLGDPQTDPAGLDGWQRQTTRAFRMQAFTGDHYFVATEERAVVQRIAGELRATPACQRLLERL